MEKDFWRARRGGADLEVREGEKICRQIEAGGQILLRGPATETPVRATLEKAQGGEGSRLVRTQPAVVGGDVGFGLFQPVNIREKISCRKREKRCRPLRLRSGKALRGSRTFSLLPLPLPCQAFTYGPFGAGVSRSNGALTA